MLSRRGDDHVGEMLLGAITSGRSRCRRGDVVAKEEMLSRRRCCLRRGDVVRGEEMLSEERRCCQRRGDVVRGEEMS
jgi:hypothetical protein